MRPRKISGNFRQRLQVNYTQWAVGAGFFHSQEFSVDDSHGAVDSIFHVIYDCGTHRTKSVMERELDEYIWRHGKCVDVLFISHFDKDHVSGLPAIKAKGIHVKRVVAPLLDPIERLRIFARTLSSNLNDTGGVVDFDIEFYGRLIANPAEALREVAEQVEIVNPGGVLDTNEVFDEGLLPEDAQRGMDLKLRVLPAHKRLLISAYHYHSTLANSDQPIWEFRYHVLHRVSKQVIRFHKTLAKELGLSVSDLASQLQDATYLLDLVFDKQTELRKAYDSLKGLTSRNDTSLCLYSGPVKATHTYQTWRSRGQRGHVDRLEVGAWGILPGWLGTGDAPLKGNSEIIEFNDIYGPRKAHVGTITLPHHGSCNNYRDEIFTGFRQPPTAVVGADGQYGHPHHEVVLAVARRGSTLIPVTSDPLSRMDESCTVHFKSMR